MNHPIKNPDIRIALAGAGKWGTRIFNTLQVLPGVSVSIADRDTHIFDTDAVIIATPSATHARVALPYIERGMPVFIEKPLATSIHDAQLLLDAAEKSGSLVFVGHLYLYHPAFIRMKELLPEIGDIHSLSFVGENHLPRADTSVVWDWLPHGLSMASTLLGRAPGTVHASLLQQRDKYASEVSFSFSFNHVTLTGNVSWESSVPKKMFIVSGTEGSIIFDDTLEKKLELRYRGAISYPEYGPELPLTAELTQFIELVRRGVQSSESLALGVSVTEWIAGAERSFEAGGATIHLI